MTVVSLLLRQRLKRVRCNNFARFGRRDGFHDWIVTRVRYDLRGSRRSRDSRPGTVTFRPARASILTGVEARPGSASNEANGRRWGVAERFRTPTQLSASTNVILSGNAVRWIEGRPAFSEKEHT